MTEAIIAALVGSIPPTVAAIVVGRKVIVRINGHMSQLLEGADAAGERRGRQDERARRH